MINEILPYLSWIGSILSLIYLYLLSSKEHKLRKRAGYIVISNQFVWGTLALFNPNNLGFLITIPFYIYMGYRAIRNNR